MPGRRVAICGRDAKFRVRISGVINGIGNLRAGAGAGADAVAVRVQT